MAHVDIASTWIALDTVDVYDIGWIVALPIERAAAIALLDERHCQPRDFVQAVEDENSYTWGRILSHNIVIASLPAGKYGLTRATITALGLVRSFPHIKVGLLVGIGAGLPTKTLDIRLGDVAVSFPSGVSGGIIQYDTGKAKPGGWERTGVSTTPPDILLNALQSLQSEHELSESKIPEFLEHASRKHLKFKAKFMHPGKEHDHLHREVAGSNDMEEVSRLPRPDLTPRVFYGNIASGNVLVRDSRHRQLIVESIGQECICLEMEAAGLMSSFPCLVIRGICDYADAYKNDLWQPYAAATATAFAKELLYFVPARRVYRMKEIGQVLEDALRAQKEHDDRVFEFLERLYTHDYVEAKDRNPERLTGTCEWFTNHPTFTAWRDAKATSKILWVSADPGCGKSVLARYLVDKVLSQSSRKVYYFFFKDDILAQGSASNAVCAMLHQLVKENPTILTKSIMDKIRVYGRRIIKSVALIWNVFLELVDENKEPILCLFDGLDECRAVDRQKLLKIVCKHRDKANNAEVRLLFLSRPYLDLQRDFDHITVAFPVLQLQGENLRERDAISKEIDFVIEHRIRYFCKDRHLTRKDYQLLLQKFIKIPQKTYLWAHLTMDILEDEANDMDGALRLCETLPLSVDEAYEKILSRSKNQPKMRLILDIILAAKRPLTVEEMSILLALKGNEKHFCEVKDSLQPLEGFQVALRDTCGLFVIIVQSSVYLLHQTARDFLMGEVSTSLPGELTPKLSLPGLSRWQYKFSVSAVHEALAFRCAWFLRLCGTTSTLQSLLEYCAVWWAFHLRHSVIDYRESRLDMFVALCDATSVQFKTWFFCYRNTCRLPQKLDMVLLSDPFLSSLHIPAFLGLKVLVQRTMWNRRIQLSRTMSKALWWAAQALSLDVVEYLLDRQALPDVLATGQLADDKTSLTTLRKRLTQWAKIRHSNENDKHINVHQCWTPLHLAAEGGSVSLLELLLLRGARPFLRNTQGDTSLHVAAKSHSLASIELLLQHGVECNFKNNAGATPLECHLLEEHRLPGSVCENICKILSLSTGEHPLLVKNGLNILSSKVSGRKDPCLDCLTFLVQNFVHIDALHAPNGWTALMMASMKSSPEVCHHLISKGANVNARSPTMETPLLAACRRPKLALESSQGPRNMYTPEPQRSTSRLDDLDALVLELLLRNGADIEAVNEAGLSCMHLARNPRIVDILITHGANLNIRDRRGMTPLLHICCEGPDSDNHHSELLTKLLEHGANVNITDDLGRNIWHYVRDTTSVKILMSHGLDLTNLNAQDARGQTPIMTLFAEHLVQLENYELAEWMLRNGADIHLSDNDEMTLEGIAISKRLWRMPGRNRQGMIGCLEHRLKVIEGVERMELRRARSPGKPRFSNFNDHPYRKSYAREGRWWETSAYKVMKRSNSPNLGDRPHRLRHT